MGQTVTNILMFVELGIIIGLLITVIEALRDIRIKVECVIREKDDE